MTSYKCHNGSSWKYQTKVHCVSPNIGCALLLYREYFTRHHSKHRICIIYILIRMLQNPLINLVFSKHVNRCTDNCLGYGRKEKVYKPHEMLPIHFPQLSIYLQLKLFFYDYIRAVTCISSVFDALYFYQYEQKYLLAPVLLNWSSFCQILYNILNAVLKHCRGPCHWMTLPCLMCVGPHFGNLVLNNCWFVIWT